VGEVLGKDSSSDYGPAGENAFTEEWQTSQTHYSPKEPQSLNCPQCGSNNVDKNGHRFTWGKEIQRYKCKKCSYRFSDRSPNDYKQSPSIRKRQLCAILQDAKKLTEATKINIVAGKENHSAGIQDVKGHILEHHVRMKIDGYKESTIRLSKSALNTLMNKGADLTDPDTVKKVISEQQAWSGNRKRNVINVYANFLAYIGYKWDPPHYEIIRKIPFIPTEQEIDDLIAASPNHLAAFLQLLKETAMRRGEAIKIPWKDVDLERRIIMCNCPEKGSNPRIFSELSGKLLNMLNNLPRENQLLFGSTTENQLKNQLCRVRKRLAFKLANPRLNEIHFHTLRHWKATMLYHYKPDMLVVAEFLGHKDLENTRLYIQLEKSLFKNLPNDQFITKIAQSTDEACKLIEVGFEYITGEYNDGGKIFRKRK
jgi:integrase/transposase-like protein